MTILVTTILILISSVYQQPRRHGIVYFYSGLPIPNFSELLKLFDHSPERKDDYQTRMNVERIGDETTVTFLLHKITGKWKDKESVINCPIVQEQNNAAKIAENKERSLRRAKKQMRNKIKAIGSKTMLTLTFDDQNQKAEEAFRKTCRKLRDENKNIQYVAIKECGSENNREHFHVVTNKPSEFAAAWTYGDVHQSETRKTPHAMSNYMAEDLHIEEIDEETGAVEKNNYMSSRNITLYKSSTYIKERMDFEIFRSLDLVKSFFSVDKWSRFKNFWRNENEFGEKIWIFSF